MAIKKIITEKIKSGQDKNKSKIRANKINLDKTAAEKLAVKARESISKYCFTECGAYCCRKGYLPMTAKQAKAVGGLEKEELIKKDILTKVEGGSYVLDLWGDTQGCPRLVGFKCGIHKSPDRPLACKEFPIFVWGKKTIRVSRRCPAVKEELLYPYLAKFKLMGYELSFGSENADNDFLKGAFIKDK